MYIQKPKGLKIEMIMKDPCNIYIMSNYIYIYNNIYSLTNTTLITNKSKAHLCISNIGSILILSYCKSKTRFLIDLCQALWVTLLF